MGTDTVVISEHRSADFRSLPAKLSEVGPLIASNINLYRTLTPWSTWVPELDWKWDIPPSESSRPELDGPLGFSIDFFELGTYSISTPPRWWQFIGEAPVRQGVREVCESIGRILGSSTLFYVPDQICTAAFADGMAVEDIPLHEIEARLIEECGPPTPWDECDEDGYYRSTIA